MCPEMGAPGIIGRCPSLQPRLTNGLGLAGSKVIVISGSGMSAFPMPETRFGLAPYEKSPVLHRKTEIKNDTGASATHKWKEWYTKWSKERELDDPRPNISMSLLLSVQ